MADRPSAGLSVPSGCVRSLPALLTRSPQLGPGVALPATEPDSGVGATDVNGHVDLALQLGAAAERIAVGLILWVDNRRGSNAPGRFTRDPEQLAARREELQVGARSQQRVRDLGASVY